MESHDAEEARRAELLDRRYGASPRSRRSTLARQRYGERRRHLLAPILIVVAALLGIVLTLVGGLGTIGAVGILLWAAVLMVAERCTSRARVVVPLMLLAYLVAVSAPGWAGVLAGTAPVSTLLGWAVILSVHPFHGVIPGVATLVVLYLWFVRTGRIR